MENRRGYPFIGRLIVGFYLVALLIALFTAFHAAAADPCWERATLSIRLDTLGASSARRLKGDELASSVRWWNQQGQVTEGEWATIILVDFPDGSGMLLIGRTEDQVCIRSPRMDPPTWLKTRLQMLGIPV
jgi:hypothetical protein